MSGGIQTKQLLTNAEHSFYEALKEANNNQYTILTKVKLEDIFQIPFIKKELYSMYRNGHIDFLLAEPETLKPIAAIELDDRSHSTLSGLNRTERKNILFNNSDLPLKRFPVQSRYDTELIKSWIETIKEPERFQPTTTTNQTPKQKKQSSWIDTILITATIAIWTIAIIAAISLFSFIQTINTPSPQSTSTFNIDVDHLENIPPLQFPIPTPKK